VTATTTEPGATNTATATTALAVSVTAVAEAPSQPMSNAPSRERTATATPLTIGLAITDTTFDSDDVLGDVTITGVPSGWSLSAGTTSGNASTWIESVADLSARQLISPALHPYTTLFRSVTATTTEPGATNTATATTALAVSVTAVAE